MSWLTRLKHAMGGHRGSGGTIAGMWRVVDISIPHPFGSYVLELREDGTLAWQAAVPTTNGGTYEASGSGTWHADGRTLHYVSGEHAGTCAYLFEAGNLILAGLPATQLTSEARCVLSPTRRE